MQSKNSNEYEISISDTNTEYIRTRTVVNVKYEVYDISIEIFNKGPQSTDNLTVKLIDELDEYTIRGVIPSMDSKNFTFKDHLLPGTDKHSVDFQILNSENETIKSLTIYFDKSGPVDSNSESSTPGFEILLVFIIMLVFLAVYKKEKSL